MKTNEIQEASSLSDSDADLCQSVSVVIPVFNEEKVIGGILQQLISAADFHEIIVVDDASTDQTTLEIAKYPQVTLLQHTRNIGNGGAVKTGLRYASGDYILLMDGDGQHPVAEIPNLLEHIDQYDMVVGARTNASETTLGRDLANWLFNNYASYVVEHEVSDLTSGFRVVRREVARQFIPILPNGFSYPTTLTISFFRTGHSVMYQPFMAPARTGVSKIRPLKDGIFFLLTITRLAVLFAPLRIFLPVSVALMLSGGTYTVGKLVMTRTFSGGGSLLLILGVILLMLGLISEQIRLLWALRE